MAFRSASRFGLKDPVTTLEELSELGVVFVSLSDAIDMSTPSGRAFAGMLSVFANFERDLISDRVLSGIGRTVALRGSGIRPPHPWNRLPNP